MDTPTIIVIVGVLIMPYLIIRIARELRKLRNLDQNQVESRYKFLFRFELLLCIIFIVIGSIFGTFTFVNE